jgi:hypothetical protein
MQRSSHKIGALATALAKVQSEIVNPEKSQTATINGLPDIKDKRRRLRPDQWPELEIAYPCRHSRHK